MLRAVKIRLYPNRQQENYINQLLGCYRLVYNKSLAFKKDNYENHKINSNLKTIGLEFHNNWLKDSELDYLNVHNTKVLKQAIINMLTAYKNFFERHKRDGVGYPKFKSKHGKEQKARFPLECISKRNDYQSNRLTFTSQIKDIKFKCSQKYKDYLTKHKDNIRSATLTKTKSGEYYMSILVDGGLIKTVKEPKNDIIGIDMGIKNFVITSEGQTYDNLKIIRNNEAKLVRLYRELSRKKKKGGSNRNKARIRLAKFNQKLSDIKENYLHYVSNQLIDENQVISIEDLNVSGMMKNRRLAKSIQELSLSKFKNILLYKAEWYGREIIEVDRYYPSTRLCSICGYKNDELTLKDREWICPTCGTNHNRDLNAAINIKNGGQRILKDRCPLHRIEEATLPQTPLEIV